MLGPHTQQSVLQAVLFGIVTVLFGLILSFIFSPLVPKLSVECEKWNENNIMELTLFATGFALRLMLDHNLPKQQLL